MKKISSILVFFALYSCGKPATTEDKLKDAALLYEKDRIGKNSKIEELFIDSLNYHTTTLKAVYGSKLLEYSAMWLDKLIEYKQREDFFSNSVYVKQDSSLIRKERIWLETLGQKLKNLDSLSKFSDSTSEIYRLNYLLKGKTDKSTVDVERTIYLHKDFVGAFDTDSIDYDLRYYPKYP